jgi:hypothetical protein
MALAAYKVRIMANACITRYDSGERTMNDIVTSYNMSEEDTNLIKAEIIAKRPDISVE